MSVTEQSITRPQAIPQYDPSLKDSDNLTAKQRAFADHYIALNSSKQPGAPRRGWGTEAARLAGYQGDDNTLGVAAFDLLRLAKIREYIRRKLRLHIMSSDEVLGRLSKHARADIVDVLTSEGEFDFKRAKKRGTSDLIRKLKTRTITRTDNKTGESETEVIHEFELHNAQTALEIMAKHHNLLGSLPESGPTVIIERMDVSILLESALNGTEIDVMPDSGPVSQR
jgi:phage terminase small subunit